MNNMTTGTTTISPVPAAATIRKSSSIVGFMVSALSTSNRGSQCRVSDGIAFCNSAWPARAPAADKSPRSGHS